MGEIHADNPRFPGTRERESKITCSATEIKGKRIGPIKDGLQMPRRAGAPQAIELQRQEMIEQIVARGDLCEHFADFFRNVRFRDGALGPGSLDRCGSLSHDAFAQACCLP